MSTRSLGSWVLPALMSTMSMLPAMAGDQDDAVVWSNDTRRLTRRELIAFTHMDDLTPRMRSIYESITAAGTNLVPFWVSVLRESSDTEEVLCALDHLSASPDAVRTHYCSVKSLFAKHRMLDQDRRLVRKLIEMVGKYGTASDSTMITPYLRDKNPATRVAAAQCLSLIGDAQSLREVETYLRSIENPASGSPLISTNELSAVRRSFEHLRARLGSVAPR